MNIVGRRMRLSVERVIAEHTEDDPARELAELGVAVRGGGL